MFSSILSAFSGMLGFSKGLDVISNNVANLNTPGFKASELQFRDLFYRYGLLQGDGRAEQVGQGVSADNTRTRYRQGDFRETGNPLDLAIDGNGFFVLRKDGETFFTRSGQFEFNEEGMLVERGSQARVAGYEGKRLGDISIAGLRVSAPRPTTEVKLVGNLSSGSSSHQVTNVRVFDGFGTAHDLTVNFTNNGSVTSRSWLIEVREGGTVVGSGEIRYQGAGSPETGFNTVAFDYAPGDAPPTTITLDFGSPGSFSGSTGFSGGTTSDLRIDAQNGFAAGSLVESSFSEAGELTLKYSNGQTVGHGRLAVAWFDSLQGLTPSGDNLFKPPAGQAPVIVGPTEGGMGKIVPSRVELSNVELTEQFTDIVVIQRGYQASSQVISVANEMAQQLLDLRARR